MDETIVPDSFRNGQDTHQSRTVGAYELHEEIGSGGMSRVYRARKIGSPVDLAIKVIRIEDVDAEYERRLRREPDVQRALGHENIVRLIDSFRLRDEFFLVMELVNGRSLAQLIYKETGPLPFARARVYVRQALKAIGQLHSLGIIHRDIKPSNILVTWDDKVKLADFGIAKFTWQQGQTKTQKGLGTPEYMSPEQARGTAIDHRTDIYSMGITLFEMLTGRKPFSRSEETPMAYVEVIQGIITRPLPDPRTFQPGISAGVVRLLAKATAKDPAERFQSAEEFLGALEVVDDTDHSPATVVGVTGAGVPPIEAHPHGAGAIPGVQPRRPLHPPGVVDEDRDEPRRNNTVLWIVLVLFLLSVGGYGYYRYTEDQKEKNAQVAPGLTEASARPIVQSVLDRYVEYARDQNPGALALLYGERDVRYYKYGSATRKMIESDSKKFYNNVASTNGYDGQIDDIKVVNDSTIDTRWVIAYDRVLNSGKPLAGKTAIQVRLRFIDGEWLITRETTLWVKPAKIETVPVDTLPEVRDLDPIDTVFVPTPSNPPVELPRDQKPPEPPTDAPDSSGRNGGVINRNPNAEDGQFRSTPRR
jgi:hypothetical protein